MNWKRSDVHSLMDECPVVISPVIIILPAVVWSTYKWQHKCLGTFGTSKVNVMEVHSTYSTKHIELTVSMRKASIFNTLGWQNDRNHGKITAGHSHLHFIMTSFAYITRHFKTPLDVILHICMLSYRGAVGSRGVGVQGVEGVLEQQDPMGRRWLRTCVQCI